MELHFIHPKSIFDKLKKQSQARLKTNKIFQVLNHQILENEIPLFIMNYFFFVIIFIEKQPPNIKRIKGIKLRKHKQMKKVASLPIYRIADLNSSFSFKYLPFQLHYFSLVLLACSFRSTSIQELSSSRKDVIVIIEERTLEDILEEDNEDSDTNSNADARQ